MRVNPAIINSRPQLGRLRNIASAVRYPGTGGSALSNGTNTTFRGRCSFFNESGASLMTIQAVFSGCYADGTNEADAPNAVPIRLGLEYPAGVFTRFLWSGSIDGTVPVGVDYLTDPLATFIPPDAQFWLRPWGQVSSGQFWTRPGGIVLSSGLGEFGEQGIGLSDTSMGGTITGTTVIMRPSGIISPQTRNMKKVFYIVLGDSGAAASGDGLLDSRGNTGGFTRAATGRCPVALAAVSGTQMNDQLVSGKMARRMAWMRLLGGTHVLPRWGGNDGAAGRTQSQVEADTVSMAKLIQGNGQKPIDHTLPPRSTSTNDWQDVAGQTPSTAGSGFFQGGASSPRTLVNVTKRTKPYPIADLLEIATACEATVGESIWGCDATFNATRLRAVDNWTVAASPSPTTTVFGSNANKATDYYRFGGAVVFDGNVTAALAGVRATVSANTSGGQFTLSSALAVAPAAGDTFKAYPVAVAQTQDGIHGSRFSSGFGGHFIWEDVTAAKIDEWNR